MSADQLRDDSDRLRGLHSQARRLRVWSLDPYCAACNRPTDYPAGFELDHITPLSKGGEDVDSNMQVMHIGCHQAKTRADLGQAATAGPRTHRGGMV